MPNREVRKMSPHNRSFLRDGIAAVLLYMLLVEWLRPLLDMSEWSGVYRISPFVIAFGLFVAAEWLRLPGWLGWPLRLALCAGLVGFLFEPNVFPHPSWLIDHMGLALHDAAALADGDYGAISPESRTMLFLVGWSMMISVIYASVIERQRAIWFVAATLLYLLGLQLWPGVNTSGAIIRAVWFGFLLIGLLQFSRLESRFALGKDSTGWPLRWLMAVPLLLTAAVAAGLWIPRAEQTGVMKPLETGAFIERLWGWGSGSTASISPAAFDLPGSVATTGFGDNDTVLGGPVRPDDSIAFVALTERSTYWRGEVKVLYTGKGWEKGVPSISLAEEQSNVDFITQEVTVHDAGLANRLFAGGSVMEVESLVTRTGTPLHPEFALNKGGAGGMTVKYPDLSDPLRYYRMTVAVPKSPVAADPPQSSPQTASAEWQEPQVDAGRFQAELQLPERLPDRVVELARFITAGEKDDYGRVKAIKSFLTDNYTYRLDAPKVPDGTVDFADYFLFVSKEGYCDYFSTTMAVMLRSVGIPSRWVKGFAPGELTVSASIAASAFSSSDSEAGKEDLLQVTVRNRNAHSWVEAYIPGYGWLPFEPTPSAAFEETAAPVLAGLSASLQPEGGDASRRGNSPPTAGFQPYAWAELIREQTAAAAGWLLSSPYRYGGFAALLLLPLLLYGWRRLPLRPSAAARNEFRYSNGRRSSAARLLDRFWLKLFTKLGKKMPGQTVREYVESLSVRESGKRETLLELVRMYEQVRYGQASLPRTAKRSLKQACRRINEP